MPGFDGNGPMGAGPMTGGRRGMCGGSYGRPGNIGYTPGYGYGNGGGRGTGFRRGHGSGCGPGRGGGYRGYGSAFSPAYPVSRADEMAMLQAEASAVKASLESIQSRIAALEKNASESL